VKLTNNFSRQEFSDSHVAQKLGIDNCIPFALMTNVIRTAKWLQVLRDRLNAHYDRQISVIISSGYRCERLNKEIKGSKNSAHMSGLAADIVATTLSPYELALFIKDNMKDCPFDQCILEHDKWVHIGFSTTRERKQFLEAVMEPDLLGKPKTKYKIFAKRKDHAA
jgi:zinc D-Ala-D-Ala carboxypeptidase